MASPVSDNTAPKRVVPTQQARQGETSGHVRMVLQISLALALIAGVVLYVIYIQ